MAFSCRRCSLGLLLAYGMHLILSRVLARVGFYRLVWHRPLFDASLYVVLTATVVLFVRKYSG